jgi:hypothetical protein
VQRPIQDAAARDGLPVAIGALVASMAAAGVGVGGSPERQEAAVMMLSLLHRLALNHPPTTAALCAMDQLVTRPTSTPPPPPSTPTDTVAAPGGSWTCWSRRPTRRPARYKASLARAVFENMFTNKSHSSVLRLVS